MNAVPEVSLKKRIPRRLVIFSGVSHYWLSDHYVAHRGFVREIDVWARLFEHVLVITRRGVGSPLSDDVPYSESNVGVHLLSAPDNTDGLIGKMKLAFMAPLWLRESYRLLTPGDVVMARGPDSIGFLGWLATRFNRQPRFAKYADQWQPFSGEPLGYRLQKMAYRSKMFGGPVMIYGTADPARPHLVPFYTSGITRKEWIEAGEQIQNRSTPPPYHLLFVGRFVYFKGIDVFLEAVKILRDRHMNIKIDLVGSGPEENHLRALVTTYALDQVSFRGWLGPADLARCYSQAHIFVHPSRKEGYGKVLVEAMSYGLPIVGTDVGLSKEMVQKNQCGVIVDSGDPEALAQALAKLFASGDLRTKMGQNGRNVSHQLLLENLETSYLEFLQDRLELRLRW